jgi:hypothetical protein
VLVIVSLDLETYLLGPGHMAPRIVCGSYATADEQKVASSGLLFPAQAAVDKAREFLQAGAIIAGANVAYDLGCLAQADPSLFPLIFPALREGRIYDVLIAESLHGIYGGHLGKNPDGTPLRDSKGKVSKRYSLDIVTSLVLGRSDAKRNDAWRTSYALLDGIDPSRWNPEARQYPVDDAVNTLEVALAQMNGRNQNLQNYPEQVEAAFALHLGEAWGLRVSKPTLDKLVTEIEAKQKTMLERFQKLGWIRPDGTEDQTVLKRAVAEAYGAVEDCPECQGKECALCLNTGRDLTLAKLLPTTDKGAISLNRDTLMESGSEDLAAYAEDEFKKIRTTYIPYLQTGIERPLSFRSNVLVATGRCSYEGSPVHQFPRKGGVRECISPRDGYFFASVDYAAGELCGLAQVCKWTVGYSKMADIINATKDPGSLHTMVAAQMLGITFEETRHRLKNKDKQAKDFRQASKPLNFGLCGGLGAVTLVLTNRRAAAGMTKTVDGIEYAGIRFCVMVGGAERCGVEKITEWHKRPCAPVCKHCVEIASDLLIPTYFKTYPEVKEYLNVISGMTEAMEPIPQRVWNPKTKQIEIIRQRGDCGYCDGANTGFQGLLADIGKLAFSNMTREAYLGVKEDGTYSPLAGARFPLFLHDEPFAELPAETAHLAGPRIAEIMIQAGRDLAPDVWWWAEAALTRTAWIKEAEPAYDENGKLIPWEDRKC